MREGKGVFSNSKKGISYDGEWKNDMKNGLGIYLDRSNYKIPKKMEGIWKNNKRHGEGVFSWIDQKNTNKKFNVRCNWNEDKLDGNVKFTIEEGSHPIFIGLLFKNGVFQKSLEKETRHDYFEDKGWDDTILGGAALFWHYLKDHHEWKHIIKELHNIVILAE